MKRIRPKTDDSLRKNLKRLMDARKMSQVELARLSGISQTHIGGILRGESDCTADTANQLAKPFGITGWLLIMPSLPDELVNGTALQNLIDAYIHGDGPGREFIDAAVKMAGARGKTRN